MITPRHRHLGYQPHSVEVVDRAKGYREFRCIPPIWSYPEARPFAALLTEFYSQTMGTDPQGLAVESEFWSGSDAALRLRTVPRDDLALRELTALASRRSMGLNALKPRASTGNIVDLARAWEPEALALPHRGSHRSQSHLIPLRRAATVAIAAGRSIYVFGL